MKMNELFDRLFELEDQVDLKKRCTEAQNLRLTEETKQELKYAMGYMLNHTGVNMSENTFINYLLMAALGDGNLVAYIEENKYEIIGRLKQRYFDREMEILTSNMRQKEKFQANRRNYERYRKALTEE